MALKLRVISDHYKALGKRSSRLFGVTGGRIGRAQDNDWILPDPDRYVSSHHCKVDFRAGQWMLEDTSTNGVFINGSDTPASVDGAYTLQDGDRLRLGDYEMLVSIDERNDFRGRRERPDARAAPRAQQVERQDRAAGVGQRSRRRARHHRPVERLRHRSPRTTFRLPRRPSPSSAAARPAKARSRWTPTICRRCRPTSRRAGSGQSAAQRHSLRCCDSGEHETVAHRRKATVHRQGRRRKPDDWQMQTRPYDRKTMQALTMPRRAGAHR